MAADSKKLKYTRDEIDSLLDQVKVNQEDIVKNRGAAETAEANSKLRDYTLQSNIDAEQTRAIDNEKAIEKKFDAAIEEIDARSDVVAVVGTVGGSSNSLASWTNGKGVSLGKITKNDVVKVLKDETDAHKDLTSYYRYTGSAKTDSPTWPGSWEWVGSADQYVVAGQFDLENGSATGSAQMKQDGASGTFSFTGKNANATALDGSLTGDINYGAVGAFSASFGGESQASGKRSMAVGTTTIAKGAYSFASGDNSVALGNDSHAEGYSTVTGPKGTAAHSEGYNTQALGHSSHSEGNNTIANGDQSHAEGVRTAANGGISHAEGVDTKANADNSHAEGNSTATKTVLPSSSGSGSSGGSSGGSTGNPDDTSWNIDEHRGVSSHAEGVGSTTYGYASHAEGFNSVAYGHLSHAEGNKAVTGTSAGSDGLAAHAEGQRTIASGNFSHAEGQSTTASGIYSHTGGINTKASGMGSFAHGNNATASGNYSVAFGRDTSANHDQFALGIKNVASEKALLMVGNNKSTNAFEVLSDGRAKVQSAPTEITDVVRKTDLDAEASRAKAAEEAIESGYMKKSRDEGDITGKKTFKGKVEIAAHSDAKGDEFLFSGIKAASANADRPVWFAFSNGSSVVNGTPTYDADFKYNPSTNKLSVGSATIDGASGKVAAASAEFSGGVSAGSVAAKSISADAISFKKDQWYQNDSSGAVNLNNSDAYNANSIYFADAAGSTGEGLRFPYDDAKSAWDTLTSAGGVLYYKPKGTLTEEKLSTASVVLHSGNYSAQIKKVALSEASTASYSVASSSDKKTVVNKEYVDGQIEALNIENGSGAGSLQTKSGSNSATGANSFAGGKSATASNAGAFAWGDNVKTGCDNQIAFGKWNTGSGVDVFEIGIGTSESARKNAFWVTSGGIVYSQGSSEKAAHSLVRLDVLESKIKELALEDASKKSVVSDSGSLASSEGLPTGKAVAGYVADQIAGKTSIAYVIDSSSSSGANKEFGYATSSTTDSFDMSSYSSKSLSTAAGATVSCSDLKVGDIVYTTGADVKDWFLGAKTDSKLTFYQISADTAALSDYVKKSGSEMTGTLTLKNSSSALSVSGPATFSSDVTISGKGFNYSGIEAANTDSDRAIWFSDSSVAGKPVYDPDFKYNPISNTLYVGTVSEGGKVLKDKYEAKGHTHSASLKDPAGNSVLSLSANTKYTLTAGGESVTFTTPKDSDTHYTNSLTVKANDVQAVKFNQDADKTLKLISGDNVALSASADGGEITISSSYVDTDTTYSFEEGTTSGTFAVTPKGGSAQTVQTKAWDAKIESTTDAADKVLELGSSYKITAGGNSVTFKMPSNTQAAASNITYDIDETAGYTVGGLEKGTSLKGLSIQEILHKIFHKFNSPSGLTIQLLGSDGNAVSTFYSYTYPNDSPTATVASVRWSVTRGAEASGKLTLSGAASKTADVSGTTASGTLALDSPVTIDASSSQKSFKLTYAYEDDAGKSQSISSNAVTLSFTKYYKCYYGTASSNAPTAAEVAAMNSDTRTSRSFTQTYSMNNSMAVYAYPTALGALSSIFDANEYPLLDSFNRTTLTIDGVECYVYALQLANFSTQTYRFN